MQTINLDISARSIIPLLHAKQGDVGRKFKAILTDGGVAYAVPAGAAVSVWYSGASGEGNYTDIGADNAVSVSGNEITVELITQMLTNYGAGSVCLVINTADGGQLGTWNIPYMVEPLPGMGSAEAQAYFTAFSQAVENLPYPDTTLSVAGRAAESAAVGTALAKKSPAGYGFGEADANTSFYYDTAIKNITKTGIYRWQNVSDTTIPTGYYYGQYIANKDGSGMLRMKQQNGTGEVVCSKINGAWQPWEWVNPPMTVGAEYRTTERYNAKPVYEKAVNCGTAPKNTRKNVAHGISNLAFVVSVSGCMTDSQSINALPTEWSDGTKCSVASVNATNITIQSNFDFSAATVTVILKYTKA